MKSFINGLLLGILIVPIVILIYFSYNDLPKSWEEEPTEDTSAEVLLNSIEDVINISLIESTFSEVYTHKDYWKFDMSPFQKQIIVKVKAKVGVGFDLSQLKTYVDRESKSIHLTNIPPPKIIYIDDTMDYYNISEGWFNEFTSEDYTKVDAETRNKIQSIVESSSLFDDANVRLYENLNIINNLANELGWSVKIK